MWGPGMAEIGYQVRSVKQICEFNYLVELEKLTKVGWLFWKRYESDITFYRSSGIYWYEEKNW